MKIFVDGNLIIPNNETLIKTIGISDHSTINFLPRI